MRVDVIKYLVVGAESGKDLFFKRAQELGILEFIKKRPSSVETPHEIQSFIDALHILRQMPPVKQQPNEGYLSANVLARHVLERGHELEKLREQARILEKEISRIEVFGEFSVDQLHELEAETGKVFQFFFAKKVEGLEAPSRPEVIHIGEAHGLQYYVSINPKRTHYNGLIEIVIDRSLAGLREDLAEVHRHIDMYEIELATLAHKKKLLKQGLIHALNGYHLEDAKSRTEAVLEGELFAVEAWIPKNKLDILLRLADSLNIFVSPVAIEEKDRIPTQIENEGAGRIGEDLINIYDTPSISDRDPSLWVFIAFGIFFSMIIADAGYGIIMLAISLWLYFKYGKKKGGLLKRFTLLSISLSIGCIIWGTLLISFFGIEFAPDSKIRDISLINWMIEKKGEYFLRYKPESYKTLITEYPQLKNATTVKGMLQGVTREQEGLGKYLIYSNFQSNVFLELAIFVGSLHILLSFARYLDKNWAGLGWIIFIIGAYLYFPSILGAVSLIHYIFHVPYALGTQLGQYLVYAGLGLAVILSLIQNRLGGLAEIMHVVQVFADIMSYLRIYALSLAGMIMATTFNNIALKTPLYIGIFIILFGHTINFVLALMGGVIHGLRLNFIEWYHYSFEGGGKKFSPLALMKLE
jgi:V/A-type H+/Na+-transporting ATPase subunit I